MEAWKSARNALERVLEAKQGEKIIIFCDDLKKEVGEVFASGALKLGLQTRLVVLKTSKQSFRQKVPMEIIKILEKHPPEIYINILRGIREETPFRIKLIQLETREKRARLGHCPGVTLDMLTNGALALTIEEHRKMQNFASALIQKLKNAVKVEVKNSMGTDLSLRVKGRPFFTDTIIHWETMKWMNLPTGEVIVAPVEDSLNGKLVCDMAVGGIGPLKTPVKIIIHNGKAEEIVSEDLQVLKRVKDSLNTDEWAKVVGEFAFGINPKARFVEEFLEAEKILGTIHIAFGNNSDMPGGKNKSKNHMNLLISKPDVKIFYENGSSFDVLKTGVFQPF